MSKVVARDSAPEVFIRLVDEINQAEADEAERNTCQVCGGTIRTMVFRGTGYCCARCEDGDA